MSQVRLDIATLHNEDIGEVVGDFHGTPIVLVDFKEAEAREARAQGVISAKVRELEGEN